MTDPCSTCGHDWRWHIDGHCRPVVEERRSWDPDALGWFRYPAHSILCRCTRIHRPHVKAATCADCGRPFDGDVLISDEWAPLCSRCTLTRPAPIDPGQESLL